MKVGWTEKPFEECIQKVTYTQKIQRKEFLSIGKYPIISQEDDFINGYWDDEKDLYKVNTPVVLFGDHTKVLKYVDFDFVLGADGVKILQSHDFLLPKYFYYHLQMANLDSLGYARHYKLLRELIISYPKITEQRHIVSILDEAFAAIAKAKEKAEKYIQYSRDLAESYLQTIFTKRNARWEEKQLRDLISDIMTGPFGSMLHKSDYVSSGVPVINPQNIVNGNIIPLQTTMVSQQTRERLSKYILKEKDLVLARRGEMGRCAIATKKHVGWICGTGSLVIRVNKAVNEKYLAMILGSAKIKSILENDSIGATMSNLNQGILLQINIPLPPLSEQHSIVSTFDAISAETKKLSIIYEKKLTNLNELRKTILQKAFNGELSGAH